MANVLIIESDPGVAKSLADALKARGVTSTITDDGNEALRLAKSEQPQLIVLCVELSRGSGYSVCNKLKKDPALAALPLILTSSQATDETFEQHKKLRTRAEAYLKKPYANDELLKVAGQYVTFGAAAAVPAKTEDFEVSLDDVSLEGGDAAANGEILDVSLDEPVQPKKASPSAAGHGPKPSVDEEGNFGGLATQMLVSDAEAERMRGEIRQLRQKLQRAEQTLQEKELEFNDRLLQESSRGRDSVELKKKLATLERDLGKHQQAAEKANAELERARQDLRQARQDVEQSEKERQVLSEKIGQLVDKVKSLAGERDNLAREIQAANKARADLDVELQHVAKVKDKAKKAVDIAMQLLDETGLVH
jgi:CheY-like chemotaxis protein